MSHRKNTFECLISPQIFHNFYTSIFKQLYATNLVMPTIHWGMNQHGKALDELGFVILIIIVMISIVILKNFHSIFFQWEILMVTHLLLCLYPDRPSFMHPIVPRPQKDEFLVLFFDNTQRNRKQQLSQKVLWCGLHFEKEFTHIYCPQCLPLDQNDIF